MMTIKQKSLLEQLDINLDTLQDEKIKETIHALFNLIESQAANIRNLQEEIQRLRDENNRLKGEQGKPKIKSGKNKGHTKNRDYSSEKERNKETFPGKGDSIKEQIKIDRTQICKVDRTKLPADAEFKGYETATVQDLKIETDNIEFRKEIFYCLEEEDRGNTT